MPLNKVKPGSNMYGWITATWNPSSGSCRHRCAYCYVADQLTKPVLKAKYSGDPKLAVSEMKTNLYKFGEGSVIFVQNMGDLFASDVENNTIYAVLEKCLKYNENTFFFQTKNPARFAEFEPTLAKFKSVILATTLETDEYPSSDMSQAPSPQDRADAMGRLTSFKKMVTVEPVMKFNLQKFLNIITLSGAETINIGADSKRHNLPEPTKEDITMLISSLKGMGKEVRLKLNLSRLMGA